MTQDPIGRPLTDLLPEEPYRTARASLSREHPVSAFEVTTKQDEDRPLNLAVTLSSLTGRDGNLEGMLAIVRDTTAQRELEAQMHQSEKLTALGQMAGGIAHDFNNLLQAILGYAQLMGKNPANVDVVRRGLDVIEKAATGGAETVRRIQKFARLRPEEAFVALDLDQVIRDAARDHAPALGREEDPRRPPPPARARPRVGARGHGTPGRAQRGLHQPDPERHRRDAAGRDADASAPARRTTATSSSPSPTPAWA